MQDGGRDGNMPSYVRDSLGQDLKNLQGLKNSLDAQRLASLAKRFYEARRILILGSDLAALLAEYLEYQMSLLGLPIFSATSAGRITHLARIVTKQDLVLGITFRRGLRQTVEGVQQAHAHGAYCVGVSDTYLSPLARECDELFIASTESTSFGASYVAPISLLNAILAACAQYRRPQTLALLKEIAEEQRKGFRWYSN
jgi:DNA-binding MurR/RpiR family transcriptional regulator